MTDPDGIDIEAILTCLYASKISASMTWVWDGGFYVTLGAPKLARGWSFPTVRDAVLWLRDQACQHFPDSNLAKKYGGFV